MTIEVITREDLNQFRFLLLNDLKDILDAKPQQQKRWLKSSELKELLGISSGTLHNLRINKTLPYSKVQGTLFYTLESIEKLLEQNKSNASPTLCK
jgi:hypothetical protein